MNFNQWWERYVVDENKYRDAVMMLLTFTSEA